MKTSCLCMLLAIPVVFGAPAMGRWQDLHRVPLPAELPPHPRVFCTPADLARIKAEHARKDPYTMACYEKVMGDADLALAGPVPIIEGRPARRLLKQAASLGQGYALSGDEKYARHAHDLLVAVSKAVMPLKRTRQAGLITDRTLEEGPVAVDFATAYDLTATSPIYTAEDHELVCAALKRVGWEAGHWCGHRDSSNWRSWGICIEAVCGFASGDRQLIEEAVNGAWDPERKCYLYGVVQQLTHSIFSDGIHWERCMGYTYYTGTALMYAMEAAKNSGIDLWHAELPGILGPFEGGPNHEEYGPAGNRSFKAFLDAPFYYAFPGGGFARIGDSNTSSIRYHRMYELAWQEYQDPKYAWLIHRERTNRGGVTPAHWHAWRAKGEPEWDLVDMDEPQGNVALRLATDKDERVALVQDVSCPADRVVAFIGRVKAIKMGGGKAHLRCNVGKETYFSTSVNEVGDWREVRVEIPAGKEPGNRSVRLHVFLEGGAGEVLWDDIRAQADGEGLNLVRNGEFAQGRIDGRSLDFWSLVNGAKDVPEGEYDLSKDATIGLTGRNTGGSTIFPVGGFAILRSKPNDPESLAVNLSYGPYGSGHDHPDRLTMTVHALGRTFCPDAGSWGYFNPMHLSWSNQTVAHNTVSINEVAQEPQGLAKGIWAGERGDQRVSGVLRLFHSGPRLKAVRATCDSAYPGTQLDRTICLVGSYLLDIYRVVGKEEQTIDLPLHGIGDVTTSLETAALPANPFSGLGYTHLEDIRRVQKPTGLIRASFVTEDGKMDVLQLPPDGASIYLARDPSKGKTTTSCLLTRVRGTSTRFVTILSPTPGDSAVQDLAVRSMKGQTLVEVPHAGGIDRLVIPDALTGTIQLECVNKRGAVVAHERAVALK